MATMLRNVRNLINRLKPKLDDNDPIKNKKLQMKSKKKKKLKAKMQSNSPVTNAGKELNSKKSNRCKNYKEEESKTLTCQNKQMPTCYLQCSKTGSNKQKQQIYCCGNRSTAAKSASPRTKRSTDSTTSRSKVSSSNSSPVPRDPFHRVPNNPYRTEASRVTPKLLLDQPSFPPTVPRWPRTFRKDEKTIPSESSRYHTPPNRSIITNDGNLITSVSRGQYTVQYEPTPSRSCSSLYEPPKYSPRSGPSDRFDRSSAKHSSNIVISVNNKYFSRNGSEPPPEYSSPPDYDSIV